MSSAVRPQRVVLVHRFFAPDLTTYAQMLDDYATYLADLGHEVTVVCGPASYNGVYDGDPLPRSERRDGFRIVRVRSPRADARLANYLGQFIFPLLVLIHILTRREPYDVVSVTTVPPVVMGVAGRLSRLRSRRTRLVYHCMDLYPEVAQSIGVLANRSLGRMAARFDTGTMHAADQVIVLSDDMAATLRARGIEREIAVSNNFILMDGDQVDADHVFRPADRTRFVFAGNLGRFQGIDTMIQAIDLVAQSRADFEFVFLGAGAMEDKLRAAQSAGTPLEVWSHRPLEQASAVIGSADVAVVSVAPHVIASAYPSKLLMYLELGRPVLAVVEPESQFARLLQDESVGIVCKPGDYELLSQAIIAMIDNHTAFDEADIRSVGRKHFDRRKVLAEWTDLYGLSER